MLRVLSLTTLCTKWQTVRSSCQLPLGSHYTVVSQVVFWRATGGNERESRAEGLFPRFSWLVLVPQKNLTEKHFQNKEFFCVCAQTASLHMHEHSHWDREAVAAGKLKKCYSNSISSLHLSSCFSLNTVLDMLFSGPSPLYPNYLALAYLSSKNTAQCRKSAGCESLPCEPAKTAGLLIPAWLCENKTPLGHVGRCLSRAGRRRVCQPLFFLSLFLSLCSSPNQSRRTRAVTQRLLVVPPQETICRYHYCSESRNQHHHHLVSHFSPWCILVLKAGGKC